MTDHLLIDGRLVPGDGPHFDVIGPATGKKHAAQAEADDSQLAAATRRPVRRDDPGGADAQ